MARTAGRLLRSRTAAALAALEPAVIVLDQLIKLRSCSSFGLYQSRARPAGARYHPHYNTGAAFSFLADAAGWQRWLFMALALSSAACSSSGCGACPPSPALLICRLALILGGALGNLIDRLRLGHVIDFVHCTWHEHYFPASTWRTRPLPSGRRCCCSMPGSRAGAGDHDHDADLSCQSHAASVPASIAPSTSSSARIAAVRRPDLRASRGGAQPHVVERLRALGAVFVEELAEVPAGDTVIFSAHGVSMPWRTKRATALRCSTPPVRS